MKNNQISLELLRKTIEIVGGANNLALKMGVSYNTILNWKNGRNSVPPVQCIKIEKITGGIVKKEEILPDYPWEQTKTAEKNDEKLEIVRKLLEKGMDKAAIVDVTGLSMEEIEKLED